MPKEIIHDQVGQFDLVVTWSADDEYVQIGMQTRDGVSIAEVLTPADVRAGIVPLFESIWGTFNRPQLQRTLAAIKRARNNVYGADE